MSLKCLCIINIFLQRHFVTSTGQQAIQANQSSVVLLQVHGQSDTGTTKHDCEKDNLQTHNNLKYVIVQI